ncbi:histidine--tRNA ligase [Mesohalobacter halotolerans]|uniref:Histidine--tRNA ligase n=1 Tax=Mesohalobacter halotolerans TaxID=1883405 RepID=A0A4U5TRP0_9FLAO|nr:histidine--tRNA ligase [Mesohalobacter halotolerans]MBS3738733.1 histidine--tRNA ligase [Psychroflexus sp.]TKS56776.1 histidine--tRNA ligase [Mesohalobacter halotolerans]
MAQKPAIPKGTRDFNANEIAKRNYIFDTIKHHFQLFGFEPIETPSFEKSKTLMGKYGDEGDRLIFKILDSGDFLKRVDDNQLSSRDTSMLTPKISGKALRYDLTVPFARYVIQHQHELNLPFKRYQIQQVYRADRPQKGRFREFYQCDADVVGSESLWQEVEFVQLYDAVFKSLQLQGCTIKMNNRKILSGLAEIIGESDKLIDFTVALDKLDKIGKDKVIEEMLDKGISREAVSKLEPIFNVSDGHIREKLTEIKALLSDSEIGLKGIEELEFIVNQCLSLKLSDSILDFDVTLARGLNYYTGAIFEVQAPEGVKMGSIGGGGRYDDLTGIFDPKNKLSGVGISFGLDRIYLVLEDLDLFPENLLSNNRLLFINFGEFEAGHALEIIKTCRENGIAAELYPDADKMKKQMTYADKNEFKYVALLGGNEIQHGTLALKNMKTGDQEQVVQSELMDKLKAILN